jgi:hypothetical protein
LGWDAKFGTVSYGAGTVSDLEACVKRV